MESCVQDILVRVPDATFAAAVPISLADQAILASLSKSFMTP